MIIVGTGGLGLEILSILQNENYNNEIVFFDENIQKPDILFNQYKVIKLESELSEYIKNIDSTFIVGIGHPRIREKLTNKLKRLGGKNTNIIAKNAAISQLNHYPEGTIIEPLSGISHGLQIGEGCAIHIHCSIGHAAKIGKYVNVGPGATVIGPTEIGDYTYIGAHAVLLPNIKIGKNVIIGAGCIVRNDLMDFESIT